jgi:hypothetical protein
LVVQYGWYPAISEHPFLQIHKCNFIIPSYKFTPKMIGEPRSKFPGVTLIYIRQKSTWTSYFLLQNVYRIGWVFVFLYFFINANVLDCTIIHWI